MSYSTLRACLDDLESHGYLHRIDVDIDPVLEMAAIHRRVQANDGPALLFSRPKGCRFPVATNIFGTLERTRWIFRNTLERVEALIAAKADPASLMSAPGRWGSLGLGAISALPRPGWGAPIFKQTVELDELPRFVSWPDDGGAYVTLPAVMSQDPRRPGWRHSNLGMYRVQLDGNDFEADEVGLHYQIHRGLGVHHTAALQRGEDLEVAIVIGGPPALPVAAVMPLPEGLPELAFAGALAGRNIALVRDPSGFPLPAEADFVIRGRIGTATKPEGPFGDHLGYYSLTHDFPVMTVTRVWARPGAVWPATVVGRPPQEDSSFGAFIHELTGPVIPTVVPGVEAVHAVDEAGVHPLMIARGSERYVPWEERRRPRELLTQAHAILGQGQMSLAKYLVIYAGDEAPDLDPHDLPGVFRHVLERIDWRRDAHIFTETNMDTLDYSGTGLNEGSKVVWAASGPRLRPLPTTLDTNLNLPGDCGGARVVMPGVLAVQAPPVGDNDAALRRFCEAFLPGDPVNAFPLITLVDDLDRSTSLKDWLWTVFTRSNPSHDIDGIGAFTRHKHWGCEGSLVIDARRKPHHAPELEENPEVTRRVEALAARSGPLHGLY